MRLYLNGHLFRGCIIEYLTKWKRAAVLLFIVWAVVAYMVNSPLRFNGRKKLDRALFTSNPEITSMEMYEKLRKRIYSNTRELWYYVNHEMIKVLTGELKLDKIQNVLDQVADRSRSLLSDQNKLSDLDGYEDWRKMEAANVSDLVQRRLHYLQNPPDCKEARKLVCSLGVVCGYGCQFHNIVTCLIFAYATERTLILRSKGWRYSTNSWDDDFHSLSDTCISTYDEKPVLWRVSQTAKVVAIRYIDLMDPTLTKPDFLPLAIPSDLAHRITRFNGDPSSWWIGQMIKYILRPRANLQKSINDVIANMDFKSPIVGIHVRRSDKVDEEAQFHHIDEYMSHVKSYYAQLELTQLVDEKRVYLATDDSTVLEDARKWYSEYTFVSDPSIAEAAATHRRYTTQSLTGLLVDLELLSRCDYLVCTMSSQVGRVAYELMQTNRVDASNSFFSLDDVYYYGGQNPHNRVAVMPNAGTNNDIAFEEGDVIAVSGNQWNGYGFGTNTDSNIEGIFPWYKTDSTLVLYPFPEYKQVPLQSDIQPSKV